MRLMSFLGRVPKNEKGYRKTRYEFDDGTQTDDVSFIGWSLIERLKPDHVVIIGTSGSMWDHLLDSIALNISDELHLALLDHVEKKSVTQGLLDQLQPGFSEFLGIDCDLVVIPYGKSMDEQIRIMEIMAHHVPESEAVALDVTHGFRHLPMLGLISAQYLQRLKDAKIHGIYYGMYDPDQQKGEIYDLKGLLQLNNWVFALSQFDKDGDYGVFSKSLKEDGFSEHGINALERAAYYERIFNVSKARQQLVTFRKSLGDGLPGAGKLFTLPLKERVDWSNTESLLSHQRKLAHFYLNNGDAVRAAVFGVEAFITSLLHHGEAEYDYKIRSAAESEFRDRQRGTMFARDDYEYLKAVRNALAHGTSSDESTERLGSPKWRTVKKTREVMQEPEKLELHLRNLFKALKV